MLYYFILNPIKFIVLHAKYSKTMGMNFMSNNKLYMKK